MSDEEPQTTPEAAPAADAPRTAADVPLPGGVFPLFVQKTAYQALIAMGVVENPLTGERSRDLGRARAVVADLEMLREKTRGNLEEDEDAHLERIVDDLRAHLKALADQD